MWNKPRDESASAPQPEAIRASAPQPAPMPRATAAIGASMRIQGEIHSNEELLVDGDVEGIVESESLLTVGPNGKIRANIRAREVSIFGAVNGNVEVTGKIAIRDQGSLIGDIKCAGISIDDGAYFKGSIDITRSEPKATAKTVKAEPRIAAAS